MGRAVGGELVRSVAWSPDGGSVVSGGHDQLVRAWDVRTGEARGLLAGHQSFVTQVAYSPGGEYMASASADSTVRVCDLATGDVVLTTMAGGSNKSVNWSPHGRYLASGGFSCEQVWALAGQA